MARLLLLAAVAAALLTATVSSSTPPPAPPPPARTTKGGGRVKMGRAMRDLIATLTAGEEEGSKPTFGGQAGDQAAITDGMAACAVGAVGRDGAAMHDAVGRGVVQSGEEYVVDMVVRRHPDLWTFLECAAAGGLLSDAAVAEMGARLLFLAVSQFGSSRGSLWSGLDGILAARPSFNWTLRADDGYNVVHKMLDRHKFAVGDVAGRLLRVTNPGASQYFRSAYRGLAQRLAAEVRTASPTAYARLRKAADRLADQDVALRQGGRRVVLGRTVHVADMAAMVDGMACALLGRLLPVMDAAPPPRIAAARDGVRPRQQPSLTSLLVQRDKFGRTPLHVAAGTAPNGIAYLRDALLAGLAAPHTPTDALDAYTALFRTDIFGYTPRTLALATGRDASAAALADAEAAVVSAATHLYAAEQNYRVRAPHTDVATAVSADGGVEATQLAAAGRYSGAVAAGADVPRLTGSALAAALADAAAAAAPFNVVGGRVADPPIRNFTAGSAPMGSAQQVDAPPAATTATTAAALTPATADTNNGGWDTPRMTSAAAQQALRAAAQAGDGCDVDIIDVAAGNVTDDELLERFLYDYAIPGRPVLLRGLALDNPLRRKWQLLPMLARHGAATFEVGEIPYVRTGRGWGIARCGCLCGVVQ